MLRGILAASLPLVLLSLSCTTVETPTPDQGMFSEGKAYEAFMGRWSSALAKEFVAFCEVGDEESLLDIGSGTGALSLELEASAPRARIIGIDPSQGYVAYAQERAQTDRLRFEVGNALNLRFEDGEFDKVLALLVINFIPDPKLALIELNRVTRADGLVAAAVWDYSEKMEMLRIFWDEAVALEPSVDQRDERHMPLCRPGELAALWTEAGLLDVEVVPLVIEMAFNSFDDYWKPFLAGQGPAGFYVASLSEDRRAQLREHIRGRLPADEPFTLTGRAWAVKGRVGHR